MAGRSLRVLLVAEESAGLQTLKLLSASEHELVGVLASPTHQSKAATVWSAAQKLKVRTWPAEFVREDSFADTVRSLDVDILLNVHSLYVIRGSILSACRIGAWNMHPGPLPQYAGLNVPSWAIYNGESEHAVTIHEMTPKIDAGTIAYESWFSIEERDNGFSLMAKCVRAGVPLLSELLDAALTELVTGEPSIPRRCQDFTSRRYFGKEAPNAGQLDWNWSARDIVNHVRASDYSPFSSPWGTPESWLMADPFGITKATLTREDHGGVETGMIGSSTEKGVLVAASDDWVEVRKLLVDDLAVDAREVLFKGDRLTGAPIAAACV